MLSSNNAVNICAKHYFCTMFKKFSLNTRLVVLMVMSLQLRPAAQEKEFNIRNFPKEDYRAASQNWGVSPGSNGFMYFANHNGLLEFDGVAWDLHALPNEVITRAVYAENDSLIYTSGYQEMGFWKREKSGILVYHSLNPLVQNLFTKNEEFWNIASLDGEIYFHSFNRIIICHDGKATPVDVPGFANTMSKVRDQVIIAVNNKGLFKIENRQVRPFFSDPFFRDKTIRFILPYQNDQFMIGTAYNGIVIWDGQSLREWNPEWTDFLKENELNRAHLTSQGHLVLGTILGGILIFDWEENLLGHFRVANGLQNNTVLGISTDQFGNIWLALDRGIDFISSRPDHGLTREPVPGAGAVYSATVFDDNIYLGTNQGLFFRTVTGEKSRYELIPGTQGQIWDCKIVGNNLLVSHNRGTLLVRDGKASFISKNSGGFSVRHDTQSDLLIQSTYSNLVAFRKQGDRYVFNHTISGFYDLIRYLEIDHLGNIWASHMHRGIYQLKLDEKRKNVIRQKYYGSNSVFQKDHGIHVFKIENRIVFTTGEKLYTYNDLDDSIIPYDDLNEKLGIYSRSHRILEGPNHRYWFINADSFALYYIFGEKTELIRTYPLSAFAGSPLVDEFENICPVSEERAILCLENGIAWINVTVADSNKLISKFSPQLRGLHLVNRRNERMTGFPRNNRLKIDHSHNNIRLRYAFPYYTNEPVYFQTWLRGLQEGWSEKSEKPIFRFDRLPPGTYELQVKATDLWNNESRISYLTLEVLPPWYQSLLAKILYILALILVLIIFRNWGVRQTRRKEKEEYEKQQQELIRLRNEKLNAEILYKSNELASSTMSIIRKNEFLLDLKQMMVNQKEQLGSRYPDKYFHHIVDRIDKNIGSQDDWLVFSTNFEQAHEQFLKKMKDDFPELTAKDLRLCAYLRMNLSSKEIAPLMGISVRGVENHRYRLRKKMGLDPEANLIDLILKY